MKLLLAAVLITSAAAIPVNHMELAKRAHVTNEATTAETQLHITGDERVVDALSGFGAALSEIFDNRHCNQDNCPISEIGSYLSEAIPGMSLLATFPDRLQSLALEAAKEKDGPSETSPIENIGSFFEKEPIDRTVPQINNEVIESMISAIIAPIVSAINNNPMASAFKKPMPATAHFPFMTKIRHANNPNGMVQFASAAESIMNDAHSAVNRALNGIFH